MKYAVILTILSVAVFANANGIQSQKQVGDKIIVTYENGTVTTNSLVLKMSPAVVKAREARRVQQTMIDALALVIADTRSNIPDTEGLSDEEVAKLYLAQMKKPVTPLIVSAPSNTVEYAIGTGIREDLTKQKQQETKND